MRRQLQLRADAGIDRGRVDVTWTNRDDIPHTIVSTEQKFKSPVLDTNEQFSHRFDVSGTYKYFCSLHPPMTGQIIVGSTSIEDSPLT